MPKPKPLTPYQRLKADFQEWVLNATYRHTVTMWSYPKARLDEGCNLTYLAERVQAATQLGYEVHLIVEEGDLIVKYKKRLPAKPWWV